MTDEKRIIVNSIRPYLYMHNAPAGTFTLTLNDEAGALVSKSFTSAEIKSDMETTDNYGYIYKTLIFDEKIQLTKKITRWNYHHRDIRFKCIHSLDGFANMIIFSTIRTAKTTT